MTDEDLEMMRAAGFPVAGFHAPGVPDLVRNPPCCERVYLCNGEMECPVHGGFDVCCDRPDLHRDITTTAAPPAPTAGSTP